MVRDLEIRPLTSEEREREVEPNPLRAEREITINHQLIQEHEINGRCFVFVNGFLFNGTYLDAIKRFARRGHGNS
jgi:hypothetical protein